jgi:GntR family transcriptional repressor for pyruvate dehydrogenase complex
MSTLRPEPTSVDDAAVVEPRSSRTGRKRRAAYEEVAHELRAQIVAGKRAHGDRLPNETELADEFGVSRATVREALRVLSAQDLIRTAKGAGGGSYVQVPRVTHISEYLHSSLNVLTAAQYVTVEQLLEARELLEVPAARLAAERRANHDVARLRQCIHDSGPNVDAEVEFAHNTDFHAIVLATSGNTLLAIAAQPVFNVLMTGFARSSLGARFHQAVRRQHREIADAIDRGDPDAAGALMHEHLEYLRPTYEKLWEQARRKRKA